MANGIQARNRIAERVSLAADETGGAELRRKLRALARTVLADRAADTNEQVDQELIRLADELLLCARQGHAAVAEKYIERIEALLARRAMPAQGGRKMGFFKKLSDKLGAKPKVSTAEAALNQADGQLFELEKKVALLSEKRGREVEKLRQLVGQAASLDAESFEYKQLRSRAGIVKKQIALYEDQINTYFRALMDNQRYKQLIDNGQAMQGLSDLIPDPAEADVLLEQLSQQIEDIRDRQDAFSDTVNAYDARMASGTRTQIPEDEDFDRAVAAARGEAAAQAAERAEAATQTVERAEAAAQTAERAEPACEAPEGSEAADEAAQPQRSLSDAQEF